MWLRIFLLLTLLLCLPTLSLSQSKTKLQGWCEDGGRTVTIIGITSSTKVQQSFPSCTVTVYDAGTTNLSTIYSNSGGSAKANPFTAASTGQWFFYATPGTTFDVKFSSGGISTPFTLSDVFSPITSSSSSVTDFVISNSLTQGPASERYTANPSSTDTTAINNTGGAPFLFEPTFSFSSSTVYRSVGVGVRTQFGSTTGGQGKFWTPYWFLTGNSATPVPAGTKGNPSGYEANIYTAQTSADMSEAVHAFGASLFITGGANVYGSAITIQASTVAASIRGHNVNIQTAIAGGTQYGYLADSTGSAQAPTAGFAMTGTWNTGLDLNGATLTTGIRLPNNVALVGRNSTNSANVNIIKLNASNVLEFGTNTVNLNADPSTALGDITTVGWTIQKLDSTGELRFFKASLGSTFSLLATGGVQFQTAIPFASLGTPSNGTLYYCNDCTNASNPCSGGGTGAFAKRLAGAWDCR